MMLCIVTVILFSCRVSEVGVDVEDEEMVVGVVSFFVCRQSVTLENMSKRSMHNHQVYKPSPNEQISPRLCPILFYQCNNNILFISRHVYYNTLIYTMKRPVATNCNWF
jgi:hypothetical protein